MSRCVCFFLNETETTELDTGEDTLALHDALPVSCPVVHYKSSMSVPANSANNETPALSKCKFTFLVFTVLESVLLSRICDQDNGAIFSPDQSVLFPLRPEPGLETPETFTDDNFGTAGKEVRGACHIFRLLICRHYRAAHQITAVRAPLTL